MNTDPRKSNASSNPRSFAADEFSHSRPSGWIQPAKNLQVLSHQQNSLDFPVESTGFAPANSLKPPMARARI